LLVDDRISTRYKHRAHSYAAVADRLAAMAQAKTGNYMAFFPSYAYLNEVYAAFAAAYPHIKAAIQSQEMDDADREAFLAAFADSPGETRIAFVVLGGVFSEGIDLKGEQLIGAAVVGVGLPMVCAERDVLLHYFNGIGRDGFCYAYLYPGMNKVLQAAERVIRTEADRGVVLLIDSRFAENAYRVLFPPEWRGCEKLRDVKHLTQELDIFWQLCLKDV
jgi:Rad3-related DNA helicase